ncbi:hypothetical protein SAMN04487949_3147 [Halogranum gelatinilyticum]|uniref:Uncharacterized protein n=1 Tax=Halogranum gelatinilyticum TaxID=660521 RepID=A0A1G9XVJ9_9EURY|nr:hypothetical protein [Halogranum gelatinilyticum]SDN00838.1 hypothetical protein SAMN04487949_3147 [Halogranum gelatinilyticum]
MALGRDTLLFALLVMLFSGFGLANETVPYDVAWLLTLLALLAGLLGFLQAVREGVRD